MTRKKIALILPIQFSVRGFLETEVYPRLREQADLLLVSPFARSSEFRARFSGAGVEHAPLHDFQPSGMHARWHSLHQGAIARYWNLTGLSIPKDVERYHRLQRNGANGSRTGELKRALRERWVPSITGNPPGVAFLRRAERLSFRLGFDNSYYLDLFTSHKPDLVVTTRANRLQEFPIARAVERLGTPHAAYILSFDNICCYGEYPRVYDHYMVWNERNKQELLNQYPKAKPEEITICGPLQFDFYAQQKKYLVSREGWAREQGLDPERPVVLFAESGAGVAPHEPEVVEDIMLRLRRQAWSKPPSLLLRLHPMWPPDRWRGLIERYPETHVQLGEQARGGTTTLGLTDGVSWDERELALLINTLYHSDVHLNVSSTMALDAAYFDRPTVCLAYDPRPGSPFGALCRRMYDREHYVDIVRSGGVTLAESPEAAVSAVTAYLESPDLNAENRRKMLKMYDPFVDGRAAERTASKILELA